MPIGVHDNETPLESNSFMVFVKALNTLVFIPPQRPLSVVTTITPAFLTSRSTK